MMIIIGWCTVYVSSAVIIFICLCAKKRKEKRLEEPLKC